MDVGNGEDFGGRVDEDRYAVRADGLRDGRRVEVALVDARVGHDVDECGLRAERFAQLLRPFDFHDFESGRTDRVLVHVAGMRGDDGLDLREAGHVGHPYVQVRIAARGARGGRVSEGRGAAGCDQPVFGAGEFGEPGADGFGEFVELYVVPGCRVHGLAYRRQHQGAAEHGVSTAPIDDGPYADGPVRVP